MEANSQDSHLIVGLFYATINEIIQDEALNFANQVKNLQNKASNGLKRKDAPTKVRECKEPYEIIEDAMMTGCNQPNDNIIAGFISFLDSQLVNPVEEIDKQIIILKLGRLIMFNATFYLSNCDIDKRYTYVEYISKLIEFQKRVLTIIKSNEEANKYILILQTIITCIDTCVALCEPKNYADQFKKALKIQKYPFDFDEVSYLNKALEPYIKELDEQNQIDINPNLEIDTYSTYQQDEDANEVYNQTLSVNANQINSNGSSTIDSSSFNHLTNLMYMMVCEQHGSQPDTSPAQIEETKVELGNPNIDTTNTMDVEVPTTKAEKRSNGAPKASHSTASENCSVYSHFTKVLFDDSPNIALLLKEIVLNLIRKLIAKPEENSSALSFITGARMKKLRCLLQKTEDVQAVHKFDETFKDLIVELINNAQESKKKAANEDLQAYFNLSNLIQSIIKECNIYSKWNPYGYELEDHIKVFYTLWQEVSQHELENLPKFFSLTIKFLQNNLANISDKDRDMHLSSLVKIYTFLMPKQKKELIIQFSQDVSKSFNRFYASFSSFSKEEGDILVMQLSLLDMILANTFVDSSHQFSSLKSRLIDNFKKQETQSNQKLLEDSIKGNIDQQRDVEMQSEISNNTEKVEKMRKMFDSVLIQPLNLNELSSDLNLLTTAYEAMQTKMTPISYFLLRKSELMHNETIKSGDLVMRLSNLSMYHQDCCSNLLDLHKAVEEAKDVSLSNVLINLQSLLTDDCCNDIHHNSFKEMFLIIAENKAIAEHRKNIHTDKGGPRFELVLKNKTKEMGTDGAQTEKTKEQLSLKEEYDINSALTFCANRLKYHMQKANEITKRILSFVITESRLWPQITNQGQDPLFRPTVVSCTEPEENGEEHFVHSYDNLRARDIKILGALNHQLVDLILNYVSVENESHVSKLGLHTLFEKNEYTMLILDSLMQVFDSDLITKEFNQLSNKHKSDSSFTTSKLKALKRRILAAHYCPFTVLFKDLPKLKSEYLANSEAYPRAMNDIIVLCSIQRVIHAYTNLSIALMQLANKKIDDLDPKFVSSQLSVFINILENPITRFLNKKYLGNTCEQYLQSIVPTKVLIEVRNERRISRIVGRVVQALCYFAKANQTLENDEVQHVSNMSAFNAHVATTLIEPLLEKIDRPTTELADSEALRIHLCELYNFFLDTEEEDLAPSDPQSLFWADQHELSSSEELIGDDSMALVEDLKNQDYQAVIKRLSQASSIYGYQCSL